MRSTNRKLIFLDIDGTLLMKGEYIPASAKEALKLAKANGHKLFIATGRSRASIPKQVAELGFAGMITSSGAYVEYAGKPVAHRPMNKDRLERLNHYLLRHQAEILYEANDESYLTAKTREKFFRYMKEKGFDIDQADRGFRDRFALIKDISQVPYVNKIVYFNADRSVEELQKKWQDIFTIVPNSVTSDWYSGEISECGIHKAVGIATLLAHLSASREEVIALGDGWNDLEMIQYAHVGVAMGNSADILKEAADLVTGDILQDGVWQAFDQLKLLA